MKASHNILLSLLEKSLILSTDIVKYSKSLEEAKKIAISHKLLESAIKLNSYLFDAKAAVRDSDVSFKISKSKSCAKDILYWLLQCNKCKDYPKDSVLIEHTNEIIKELNDIFLKFKENKSLA